MDGKAWIEVATILCKTILEKAHPLSIFSIATDRDKINIIKNVVLTSLYTAENCIC